jgi:hypothetical protein
MAFSGHAFAEHAFSTSSTLGRALMYARLNVMRLGASRLDYYQPIVRIEINGVWMDGTATKRARVDGLSVRDYLDGTPNTATVRVTGFTPTRGHEIKIGLGNTVDPAQLVFAGHILSTAQVYEVDNPANVAWDLSCISYEWLLNRRKVNARYLSESATDIILDAAARFAPNLDVSGVEADLPDIDEIQFTDEDFTQFLDRVMRRIGGYWKQGEDGVLYAFLTESESVHPLTEPNVGRWGGLTVSSDDSQRRTRVVVVGGGSTSSVAVSAGETVLPVEDDTWYDPAGGIVKVGQQRVTYTGTSEGNGGSEVAVAPVADATNMQVVLGSGTSLAVGLTVRYKVTFTTASGETLAGPATAATVTTTSGFQTVGVGSTPDPTVGIPIGPSGVTGRKLYRQHNLTGPYGLVITIANNTATGSLDTNPTLGAAEPSADTSGLGAFFIERGATSLPVLDTSPFSASGGLITVGGQVISYTGRSVASGTGDLTGIPASGTGSITVRIPSGTSVLPRPQLTGIPASGEGAILYDIPQGEAVNIVVVEDDLAAQAAMQLALGSSDPEDGIFEEVITDQRLSSVGAHERAQARLTEVKDPLVEVRYVTKDQTTRAGRSVTITVGPPTNVSGTFKIQTVTLDGFDPLGLTFPLRTVEASSRRLSFDTLLRVIRQQATV